MPDLFEIVDAGFLHAEEQLRPATFWWHPLPDAREAAVAGDRLSVAGAAQDAYVYETPMAAVLAAARWIEAGGVTNPRAGRATRQPAERGSTASAATSRRRGSARAIPTACRASTAGGCSASRAGACSSTRSACRGRRGPARGSHGQAATS